MPTMPSSRCHASGDAEHDERERSAGHRLGVEFANCCRVGQRQIAIDRPYCLLHLAHECGRARAWRANDKRYAAPHRLRLPFEFGHQDRPIHGCRRLLADSVVVDILCDADDLAPVVGVCRRECACPAHWRARPSIRGPGFPTRGRQAASGRFQPRSDRVPRSAECPS